MSFWPITLVLVGVYCFVRAAIDFKERRYWWGALGLASGAAIILVPIPTHTVKVDLPAEQPAAT